MHARIMRMHMHGHRARVRARMWHSHARANERALGGDRKVALRHRIRLISLVGSDWAGTSDLSG